MQVIVIRERGDGSGVSPLRYALSTDPLNRVVLEGLDHLWRCRRGAGPSEMAGWTNPRESHWIVPGAWHAAWPVEGFSIHSCDDAQAGRIDGLDAGSDRSWIIVTDGRFATCVNHQLLARVVALTTADVIAVKAAPDLLAYRERVRLTQNNELVGYRRLFADSVAPIPMPVDWPHHLLVRPQAFDAVVRQNLGGDFRTVIEQGRAAGLKMRGIAVGGSAFDLESEAGVLAVCGAALERSPNGHADVRKPSDHSRAVSGQSRFVGPVLLGRQVTVEPGAVVVGPTVLCDGCTIGHDAVVDGCVVGTGVSVAPKRLLRARLALRPGPDHRPKRGGTVRPGGRRERHVCAAREGVFRTWPRFSYAGYGKRVADVVAAVVVLLLFAPVIPVIALAIRLSSPGPVFFRDKRQGRHGVLFDCLKFRTMRRGADKMQEKLRFVCEVDGPQFKMADDPRITAVGRFLRETYLDEIPQFYNVLCGQMSVVGPRPSPEFENTLCPSWRDARLSVRPGITGLWQICRTRAAHKDFQEWIQYDTKYVRDLSPGLDLWICWRTFRRMVANFVDQF